jgi:hypothetical protein
MRDGDATGWQEGVTRIKFPRDGNPDQHGPVAPGEDGLNQPTLNLPA